MDAKPSNWDTFEEALLELLKAIIETRLGWTVLQGRRQASGAQFGKDIQLSFRTPDGRIYYWHIECKAHKPGNSITKEEILPKLFDLWRSDHQIDVWCIASANVELGNAIDELVVSLAGRLELPFAIARLSPGDGEIQSLFALEPSLYAKVYPDAPLPTGDPSEETELVTRFERFLLDASTSQAQPAGSAWQLVAPHRIPLEADSSASASAYLRGFESSGWEAVVYGWATPRPSSSARLVALAKRAPPGFSYTWLIGSAGEGKSTVMRQAAWELAADPSLIVLWTEAEFDDVELPTDWVAGLRAGSRVVLCVDGTRGLSGAGTMRHRGQKLGASELSVFALFCDRGGAKQKGSAHRELSRWTRPDQIITISKLDRGEAETLVQNLESRSLVSADGITAAIDRVLDSSGRDRAPGTSWLLPALMELTDPGERNFEQILESVLIELKDDKQYDAAKILLAAALAQAGGVALPVRMGERVIATGASLRAVLDALETELEQQGLGGPRGTRRSSRLLTHHRVVAEAYVQIGVRSGEQHGLLLDVCGELPSSDELDEWGQVPDADFEVLDGVVRYLHHHLQAYEHAATTLEAWIDVDPAKRNFLAMHRLGSCLTDWTNEVREADSQKAADLIDGARIWFRATLEMITYLRTRPAECPPRIRQRLAPTEYRACHAWAVIEDIGGQEGEGQDAYWRSAYFGFLSFNTRGAVGKPELASCGQLALVLLHLKEYELAARVVSALAELAPSDRILQRQRSMLAIAQEPVPTGGVRLLGAVFARLAERFARPTADVPWPETRSQQIVLIGATLERLIEWIPDPEELKASRQALEPVE